jgi:hypothetical protein
MHPVLAESKPHYVSLLNVIAQGQVQVLFANKMMATGEKPSWCYPDPEFYDGIEKTISNQQNKALFLLLSCPQVFND